MSNAIKILLVEDSDDDTYQLIRYLKKEGIKFSYLRVWLRETFINALKEDDYDLIIADQMLPQFSGIEAFRIAKKENKGIPFILITGSVSERTLMEYAKEGVNDYILKDNLLRLSLAIDNVLSRKRIENLHQELELSYSEIRSSIDYANLIQRAMLPDEFVLRSKFPGSFVYFHPKDILSGDFYWFREEENIFSVAVADCTGHGIPGALLSMMGINILYEIIVTKKATQPSVILSNLNKQVQKVLRNGVTTLNDGMDIAICSIDLLNMNMMYAGANRPLFIGRGDSIIEYKPDKKSIGGIDNNKIHFNNHHIPLQSGDRIFLFTDGYADQFSDKTDKKMTVKRLKDVLSLTVGLKSDEQKKYIINYFEDWKGNKEQIDDVLLLCVQIQ
ncbi:MAG TPA: SpoIIE family protein phosphatase [Bacteroidia bacterium]|nr:SpoIIE family protein phosphatase [Bacteroidia bacterium]